MCVLLEAGNFSYIEMPGIKRFQAFLSSTMPSINLQSILLHRFVRVYGALHRNIGQTKKHRPIFSSRTWKILCTSLELKNSHIPDSRVKALQQRVVEMSNMTDCNITNIISSLERLIIFETVLIFTVLQLAYCIGKLHGWLVALMSAL